MAMMAPKRPKIYIPMTMAARMATAGSLKASPWIFGAMTLFCIAYVSVVGVVIERIVSSGLRKVVSRPVTAVIILLMIAGIVAGSIFTLLLLILLFFFI